MQTATALKNRPKKKIAELESASAVISVKSRPYFVRRTPSRSEPEHFDF